MRKLTITLFVIISLFIGYKYYKYTLLIEYLNVINNDKQVMELVISNYFDIYQEYPSKEPLKQALKEYKKNRPYLKKNQYDIDVILTKNEFILYAYGIDNSNNQLEKKLVKPNSFFDFLSTNYKGADLMILKSNNFDFGCNKSFFKYRIFDKKKKLITNELQNSSFKEYIRSAEKFLNKKNETDTVSINLIFRYKEGNVVCLCKSRIRDSKVNYLENELTRYFSLNKIGYSHFFIFPFKIFVNQKDFPRSR